MNQQHTGSDLDDFLEWDGLLAECKTVALKRVLTSLSGDAKPVTTESEEI